MRWLPLVLVLAATPSVADAGDKPVRVTGRLDGATARLSARFALTVRGGQWTSSHAHLALPERGLVTAARATVGGVSHALALIDAEAGSAQFAALADEDGKRGARASAVLIEDDHGAVSVSVASARSGVLTLDLEVAVPTCYAGEVRYLTVPVAWGAIAGELPRARRARDDDDLAVRCGSPEEHTRWVGFADHAAARLPSGDRVGASGDRVDLGDASFVRVELDLANLLADVPRDLATVLVVDGSRSMWDHERKAQRDIARAYLAKVPGTRVQVVAFARYAKPLLPAWTPATSARTAVDKALAALVPENGSNLDIGLAEASTWLARVKGTKRIVLITDQRMARRLKALPPEALKQAVPPGTLVHVVVATGNAGDLYRDDTAKLAGLAAATEGMLVIGGAEEPGHPLDVTRLVRPIALEQLTFSAPGWTALPHELPGASCVNDLTLWEGEACTWWGQGTRSAGEAITIGGKLWGRTVTRVITPTAARALDVARELTMRSGVSAQLRPALAERAQAVNGTWSLYVAWGGTGAYQERGDGTGTLGVCGCASPTPAIASMRGVSGVTTSTAPPQVDLATQLAAQLATCRLGAERVDVEVELTFEEVADVHVEARTAQGADKHRLEQCVAEVVWASAPVIVRRQEHQVMTFVAGG